MITLELAKPEDAKASYAILDAGRNFQRAQGFIQWDELYPTYEMVVQDIAENNGYVVKVDGQIASYMRIDFNGEPAYVDIKDGQWGYDEPYCVIHRMAIGDGFRGAGLFDKTMKFIEEYCISKGVNYIRMDTNPANKRMQHLLDKNGYTYRGMIYFQGGGKVAYDKKF